MKGVRSGGLSTGREEVLAAHEGAWGGEVAVSPDGRTFLYTRQVSEGADIMLVEKLR